MFNEESIRKYAQLMTELDLSSIEVSEDNRSLRLERQAAAVSPVVIPQAAVSLAAPSPQAPAPAGPSCESIISPMVGVFYAAPAEDADPYVKVGDRVKKGDVLCIIEAMKLMNEITCEFDGVIKEICAVNAQVVEYGAPLFKIER